MSRRMDELGLDTLLVDMDGKPIHIGDTLWFDPKEWGDNETNISVVRYERGEVVHNGSTGDLEQWCRVIKKWNE